LIKVQHLALQKARVKQGFFLLSLLIIVAGKDLCAADLQAVPEFLRSDPFGSIVAPDRERASFASSLYDARHRVVLSGCRGGYVSFQL
jgi:hypothetical protein